jgi:hypothetical protein
MTPTLPGRWHTRLLLFIFIGLPITLIYAFYLRNWSWPPDQDPFVFLTFLTLIGLLLDIVYVQIQKFRWDHDWPFIFQFFSMIFEFVVAYLLMELLVQTLDFGTWLFPNGSIPIETASTHFILVFIPSFIALLGFVQIFLVRWRFKGGEISRFSSGV